MDIFRHIKRYDEIAEKFVSALYDDNARETEVAAEFDAICLDHFGFTRGELVEQVPEAVLSGLNDWYFDEILDLGMRHGFDFRYYNGLEGFQEDWDQGGSVATAWEYWAEVLIAKECGFFPTTSEQLQKIRLERERAAFKDKQRRERMRAIANAGESDRVFGRRGSIQEGTITAPVGKNKTGGREIKVERKNNGRRVR